MHASDEDDEVLGICGEEWEIDSCFIVSTIEIGF